MDILNRCFTRVISIIFRDLSFCISAATVGVSLFIILMIVAIYLLARRRKNNKKNDNGYYVDGESEVLKLNLINSYLRRRIEGSLLKDPEKLQVYMEIGSGNFGKVYSGQFMRFNNSTPVHVAVKTLKGKYLNFV